MTRPWFVLCTLFVWAAFQAQWLIAAEKPAADEAILRAFRLPAGITIEKVAGQPLIDYPLFACFDDRGRLYVAEGTGKNLPGTELVKLNLGRVVRLEDTDNDGRFDARVVFADGFAFPQGVLWHEGAVYVASHPAIWRLEDTDGDGRSDKRVELVGKFGFNGNGCDLHGPFLGPDGWLYWTDGRHGYKVETREGSHLEGFAARIWRCRTDGTRIERICGGGFDNPVELVFTETGEMVGTMDQGTGDALLHYIEGGVYPRDDHPCLSEFVQTGPLLAPITSFSAALPAALCGLVRLRSNHFGEGYAGSLLTAQFNVHRVQQHVLSRTAATFQCTSRDFVSSSNYDLRLSDVLEDADGSLLLVDMGAWFNYGCPTAKIAKPEIKGSIYRVRRKGAPRIDDPWGGSLDFEKLGEASLIELLRDRRFAVCDRAKAELARRGDRAVTPLAQSYAKAVVDTSEDGVAFRRELLWTLCHICTEDAQAALRRGLDDPDVSVKMVAAHAAGLERDPAAVPQLEALVIDADPALRRRAAEALGRIGAAHSAEALFESLRRGGLDRFLEHALIYALIGLKEPEVLTARLSDSSPVVRRAALVALDQSGSKALTRELVVPLLDTDDHELQQSALAVLSRNAGWADQIRGLLRDWLQSQGLSESQERSLTGALLAQAESEAIQQEVAAALSREATTVSSRRLLLRVILRARLPQLPRPWEQAVDRVLTGGDLLLARDAVEVVRARRLTQFDAALARLADGPLTPAELRIAALECLAPRRPQPDAATLAFLKGQLSEEVEPLVRVAAARTLGSLRPGAPELRDLAQLVAGAGPLTLPLLLPAFSQSTDVDVGRLLVKGLEESPGSSALSHDELRGVFRNFPDEIQVAAGGLYTRQAERAGRQEAYLTELVSRTLQSTGNPERGRQVFFSQKVGCAGCHRMEGRGGAVGPDLSLIGRIRDPRALLEAVVFPSSTVVPEFRSYVIATKDGKSSSGMIVAETSDAVFLRTSQLAEIRLPRSEIEEIRASDLSIMPEGLEKTMTDQEFADLLEFLYQRR